MFETGRNEFGEATVSVRLRDDGGIDSGGADVNVRPLSSHTDSQEHKMSAFLFLANFSNCVLLPAVSWLLDCNLPHACPQNLDVIHS